jgi:hypothetical protein
MCMGLGLKAHPCNQTFPCNDPGMLGHRPAHLASYIYIYIYIYIYKREKNYLIMIFRKKEYHLEFFSQTIILPVVRVVFGPDELTISHWVNLHITFFS